MRAKLFKILPLFLLLSIIWISVNATRKTTEYRSRAVEEATNTSPFAQTGTYSIGYKRLQIKQPFVWYWAWDNCNCNPLDLKCLSDPYNTSKVCSEGATGNYPYGPFGGYSFTWGFKSPSGILNLLNQASQSKIGIGDYTKPLWITGPIFSDSGGNAYVAENELSRLYCGVQSGKEVYKKIAIFNLLTPKYLSWISETASLIKNHSNLAAITITHGLDGESRCKPDECTNKYPNGTVVADPCVGYEGYKKTITDAYYKYFCNGNFDEKSGFCRGTMKPVYLQTSSFNDAGGTLGRRMPPMGMKHSGFVADSLGIIYGGKWRGYGLLEAFRRYSNLIPIAIEPRYGNWFLDNRNEGGGQGTYWWNLEALWLRPTAIDINPGYGFRWQTKEDSDYVELMNSHLNVNAQTTPDVWIALRDTPNLCGAKTLKDFENNPCLNKSSAESGKVGDYDFYLKRPGGLPGNKTVILTRPDVYPDLDKNIEPFVLYNREIPQAVRQVKYARHIRRTDKATGNYYMSFDVDNDYPWANKPGQSLQATVYYLDLGNGPFYLEYKNAQNLTVRKEILRKNSQTWQKAFLTLDDAFLNDGFEGLTDFRIFNGGASYPNVYLHMIKVKGLSTKPAEYKRITNITCSLPNESVMQGESPLLKATLTDAQGQPLANRNLRITADPYWYTDKISFATTDSSGLAQKNLDLSSWNPFYQDSRSAHEIEIVFPGDAIYRSSSTICYLPLNIVRGDFTKRKLTATLSKNEVRVGDTVTVTINTSQGGIFSVEGEGFGMPACTGTADGSGKGSCSFLVGGMAIAGRRTLGITTGWYSPYAAVSINLPITVIDDNQIPEGNFTPPPQGINKPVSGTTVEVIFKLKLKGVYQLPNNIWQRSANFKVKIDNQEFPAVNATVDSQGLWTMKITTLNFVPGEHNLYFKGPKHLQKKFIHNFFMVNPVQTIDLGTWIISNQLSPGDLPNYQGVQDGTVNSQDGVFLTSCFETPENEDCLIRADLNLDGTVNTVDMELMNSTIISADWSDED